MFLEDCLGKFLSCDHLPKVVSKKQTFCNCFSHHQMMTSQRSKEQFPCIHSFYKYLSKICSVPGTVLGVGNTVVNIMNIHTTHVSREFANLNNVT